MERVGFSAEGAGCCIEAVGVVVTEFAAGKTFGDKSICLNFDFSSFEQSRHEDIVQGGVCHRDM